MSDYAYHGHFLEAEDFREPHCRYCGMPDCLCPDPPEHPVPCPCENCITALEDQFFDELMEAGYFPPDWEYDLAEGRLVPVEIEQPIGGDPKWSYGFYVTGTTLWLVSLLYS